MVAKENEMIESKDLALSEISREEINVMVEQFKDLKVIPDDKDSYGTVKSAKMKFVHLRTSIDKNRKRLNEDAQKEITARNALAKELFGIFAPAEEHLASELKKEDDRLEAIRQEKIRAEEERVAKIRIKIDGINSIFMEAGYAESSSDIQSLINHLSKIKINEKDFGEFKDEAENEKSKAMERLNKYFEVHKEQEKKEAEAKAESERLEKIRKDQAEAQAKIDAENARIAEEKRIIQKEKDRIDRDIREAKIREEEKIKAEKEAKEKAEREAREKAEKEEAERKEKERIEALKPDKQKIKDYIALFNIENFPKPKNIKSAEIRALFHDFESDLEELLQKLEKRVEDL